VETIVAAALAALAAVVGSSMAVRVARRAEETKAKAAETAGKIDAVKVKTEGWQVVHATMLADYERMRAERDAALGRAEKAERERDVARADLAEEHKIVQAFSRRMQGTSDEE
jgi:hypothetical protein